MLKCTDITNLAKECNSWLLIPYKKEKIVMGLCVIMGILGIVILYTFSGTYMD